MISNNIIKCTIALAALKDVIDPEIGLNVTDLGLIYQIDFDETERRVFVMMTLTTQFCPMGESITHSVKKTLENSFHEEEVLINLTFNPPWNYERISEVGQKYLTR